MNKLKSYFAPKGYFETNKGTQMRYNQPKFLGQFESIWLIFDLLKYVLSTGGFCCLNITLFFSFLFSLKIRLKSYTLVFRSPITCTFPR